jgi:hypothetical protein
MRGRKYAPAVARRQPHPAEYLAELRPVARDPDIRHQRQIAARAHGRPVHRRNHRLLDLRERQRNLLDAEAVAVALRNRVERRRSAASPFPPQRSIIFRSPPEQKALPAPVTISTAAPSSARNRSSAADHGLDHLVAERVAPIRIVQRQRRHTVPTS